MCGKIDADSSLSSKHTISFTNDATHVTTTTTAEKGEFCLALAPGIYTVEASISIPPPSGFSLPRLPPILLCLSVSMQCVIQPDPGSQLTPSRVTVDVSHSPVTTLHFTRFKAHISGSLSCIGE